MKPDALAFRAPPLATRARALSGQSLTYTDALYVEPTAAAGIGHGIPYTEALLTGPSARRRR